MQECLTRILGAEVLPGSWEVANLPLSLGGLGLRSVSRSAQPPNGPVADCLQTTALRQPAVAEQLTTALSNGETRPYLRSAVAARDRLLEVGFPAPVKGDVRRGNLDEVEPGTRLGWQPESSLMLEERFVKACGRVSHLSAKPCSVLKEGPWQVCHALASRSLLTAGSTLRVFRVLFLGSHNCTQLPCGLPLDSGGATTGVLGRLR